MVIMYGIELWLETSSEAGRKYSLHVPDRTVEK